MTRADIEELVRHLVAAPTSEAIRELIAPHAMELGALFYEILEAHASADFAADVAAIHMAARGPAEARLLEIVSALLQWRDETELHAIIERHARRIDDRVVEALLDFGENAIVSRDDPRLGDIALRTARCIIERLGLDALYATLRLHEGNLYLRRGALDAADRAFREVLESESPPLVQGAAAVSRGQLLMQQGRAEDAAIWYRQALPRIQDSHQRLMLLGNLAMAELSLGHISAALAQLKALAAQSEILGDEAVLANTHGNLALVYERLGEDAKQEFHLLAGHKLQARPIDPSRQIDWGQLLTSCINLHIFYMNAGRLDDARHWLSQVEDLFAKTQTDPQQIVRKRLRIGLALESGDTAAAWRIACSALSQFSSAAAPANEDLLLLLGNAGRAALAADKYEVASKTFMGLVALCTGSDNPDLLVSSLGYAAVAFLRLGQSQRAFQLLSRMVAEERTLRAQVDAPLHQFGFSGSHERLYDNLIAALCAVGSADGLFEAVQSCKAFAIGRSAPRLAAAQDISAALTAGSAFLEFDHHGGGSQCLIVRAGEQQPELIRLNAGYASVVAAALTFEKHMAWARFALSDAPFDCLDDIGEGLLGPVLRRLGDAFHNLVIAPAGAAARLPFHLFRSGGRDRLIDRCSVAYAPSATVWLSAAGRSRTPKSAIVLANGRETDAAPVLANFAQEARLVRAVIGMAGLNQPLGRGNATSTRNDLLAHLNADILHVAAHGLFDADRASATGVLLSQEGHDAMLSLETLASSAVSAELVYLSGCETARVSALRNQEVLGLMSILLSRNTTAAVLSYWPVLAASDDIVSLVDQFYRNWLLGGLSKAQALRVAMLGMRSRPVYAWGGFGVFGFGD